MSTFFTILVLTRTINLHCTFMYSSIVLLVLIKRALYNIYAHILLLGKHYTYIIL